MMYRVVSISLALVAVALASAMPRFDGAQAATGTGGGIFRDPLDVAVDPTGYVYVTDQGAAQIIKLSPDGHVLARWGHQGTKPGELNVPEGIAADGKGHVYVADTWNGRVQKFSASGRVLAVWGQTANRLFFRPLGVATGGIGNVYVVDNEDDWAYRLSPEGRPLAQLGHFGNPTQGVFRGPQAVAVNRRGFLLVASYNWIYKVSPSGKNVTAWGTLRPGRAPGRFYLPSGVATDAQGRVYVADSGNNRVQVLSERGRVLHVWGSSGSGVRQFHEPNGIAVDRRGSVYVVDTLNRRVVKMAPTGNVLAVWQ